MINTKFEEIALLILVYNRDREWTEGQMAAEFSHLVASAGIGVKELVVVKLREINPALFIGKGKLEELVEKVQDLKVNVVIFNNELSFAQQRNLEEAFGIKTIDRTQLILDIFANHAHTQEGMLQVELAQLQYLLPRLKGKGIMLSRLGGGIGTRGPGEKKIEVDRRKIEDRITRLKHEIVEIRQHRNVMRKKREKQRMLLCSLVGYTSAGKTTLFNAITESTQKVSSSLFTTLDTVTHNFFLHNNLKVLLSDTVGFLYNLPHKLIEAFRATLEELRYADVILHIVDAAIPDFMRLINAVNVVLAEIKIVKPIILVMNKVDLLKEEDLRLLKGTYPDAVYVSALTGDGILSLKEAVYARLFVGVIEAVVKVPFTAMEVLDYLHAQCEILKIHYDNDFALYWVRIKEEQRKYLEEKKNLVVKKVE